jgi:hypothetical protein
MPSLTAEQADSLHLLEVPLNKLFTNDTGHFPVRARSGHQYIMVAYHFNANTILIGLGFAPP